MNKKLQYKFSPDHGDGVHWKHNWTLDESGYGDTVELQEMVAWCYENWNDDPGDDHDWQYVLMADIDYSYDKSRASWNTIEYHHHLYFGTDDDQWAALFKLMWSDYIEVWSDSIVCMPVK
jgi:hypothetical protein